jgi:hypothetical protein
MDYRQFHYCPVCFEARVYRPTTITCGAAECMKAWRKAPRALRIQCMEKARDQADAQRKAWLQTNIKEN